MSIAERSTRLVNVGEFASTGEPENLGSLYLSCPFERQYILRMVVRADSRLMSLPPELKWLVPLGAKAVAHQWSMRLNHPFCYITVRHGVVTSQTDDQWHVDGFSTRQPHVPEQNYIWCNTVGTEYVPLEVPFPKGFDPLVHNINSYLQKFIDPSRIANCEENTLYCMDPYILHRRPPTTAGMVRTFVRMSFVPIEINDVNNTPNPLLPRAYNRDGVEHRNTLIDYEENA